MTASDPWVSALALLSLGIQIPAVFLLLARLLRGPFRRPPLIPQTSTPDQLGAVSVVVPTLNEAARLQPCLDGLSHQSYEMREVLVIDSRSQDGTPELVRTVARQDPRFRVLTDDPLPPGWVGRPWALQYGFKAMSADSDWFLGLDADTQPHPGLIASLLQRAIAEELDAITLSPRFILCYPGELWLQPALLITLVYRFGPAGEGITIPERMMANGQCLLCRRSVLESFGGFSSAQASFCDDVTLIRHLATHGVRVGFLDGAQVLKVRMYEGAIETWREWGRSLDLKDASSRAQTYGDLWFLAAVQGLPLLLWIGFVLSGVQTPTVMAASILNATLVLIRVALVGAISPSYDLTQAQGRFLFWLSPLADPFAVGRVALSAVQRPRQWRGRQYG